MIMAATLAVSEGAEYGNEEQDFDTGLVAWLQVFGAFFLYFNSWYVTRSEVFVRPSPSSPLGALRQSSRPR